MKRAPKVYVIDTEPYRSLIDEFIAHALIDPTIGIAIATTATNIQKKRRDVAAKKTADEGQP